MRSSELHRPREGILQPLSPHRVSSAVPCRPVTLGGGAGGGSNGEWLRGEASRLVERDGKPQFDSPSYNASFRSVLVGVLLFVAILVGVFVIFT
jgi:hypothetical protein